MISEETKNIEEADREKVYEKKSKDILEKTLSFSELKLGEEIDYRPVKIFENNHVHEIYTINHESSHLPHMVMLHGFGGTAMTYVRMFKRLNKFYKVHALDSFGVGHSSFGSFTEKFTYEQTRDYFVDAIQAWRKKLGIEEFILVGHSFGGYIATLYVEKYPERVTKLLLLSPVGMTEKTEEEIQTQLKEMKERNGLKSKFFMFFAEKIFNMNIKPSSAMNSCLLGNSFIDRVVSGRLGLDSEEKQSWTKYFKDISKKGSRSQSAFYIIFEWPLKPKHTIESILSRIGLKIKVQFYFGDQDWMDKVGAQRLHEKLQNFSLHIVGGAGHQLIFDNPDGVTEKILKNR